MTNNTYTAPCSDYLLPYHRIGRKRRRSISSAYFTQTILFLLLLLLFTSHNNSVQAVQHHGWKYMNHTGFPTIFKYAPETIHFHTLSITNGATILLICSQENEQQQQQQQQQRDSGNHHDEQPAWVGRVIHWKSHPDVKKVEFTEGVRFTITSTEDVAFDVQFQCFQKTHDTTATATTEANDHKDDRDDGNDVGINIGQQSPPPVIVFQNFEYGVFIRSKCASYRTNQNKHRDPKKSTSTTNSLNAAIVRAYLEATKPHVAARLGPEPSFNNNDQPWDTLEIGIDAYLFDQGGLELLLGCFQMQQTGPYQIRKPIVLTETGEEEEFVQREANDNGGNDNGEFNNFSSSGSDELKPRTGQLRSSESNDKDSSSLTTTNDNENENNSINNGACESRASVSGCQFSIPCGYTYYPGKIYHGFDLGAYHMNIQKNGVASLAELCLHHAHCKSFNTEGWYKDTVIRKEFWEDIEGDCQGTFVKEEYVAALTSTTNSEQSGQTEEGSRQLINAKG